MSANSWGLYRDRNTGRVGEYPADAAAIFTNLEPVSDEEAKDCIDCEFDAYPEDDVADDYGFDVLPVAIEGAGELDYEDEEDE